MKFNWKSILILSLLALLVLAVLVFSAPGVSLRGAHVITLANPADIRLQALPTLARLPANIRPLVTLAWARASSVVPVVIHVQGGGGYQLVIGDTYTLHEGETLEQNLLILDGMATLEENSVVDGDAILMGGTLRVDGTIGGSITALGGLVDLGNTAVVEGDVNIISGNLERAQSAQIDGEVHTSLNSPFPVITPNRLWQPNINMDSNPFWDLLWLLFRSFMWAALAVILVLFLPEHTRRVADAALGQPFVCGGLGLMTVVVAPLVILILAISVICSPLALAGAILVVVGWVFGVIVLGMETGRRIARALKQEWAPAVMAGIGAGVLTLVVNAIGWAVPCVGWVAPAVVGMLGLGGVLLTRFGTQNYPPGEMPLAPPDAPLPPPPGEPLLPSEPPVPPEPPVVPGA